MTWSAPSTGGRRRSTRSRPTSARSAAQPTTVTGTPPATNATVTGLKPAAATRSPCRRQPERRRARPRTPPTPSRRPRAPRRRRRRKSPPSGARARRLVSWTAPTSNGGSAITGYKITPYAGGTAQATPVAGTPRVRLDAPVTGLTNGTSYTFTVSGHQRHRRRVPASAPSAAITPQDTIFDFATPATVDSGRRHLGRARREVHLRSSGQRSRVSASTRRPPTPAPTSAACGRSSGTLLASATFTGETASGWQQVNFSTPVAITANTTYVAALLRAQRPLLRHLRGLRLGGVTNPPLTRARQRAPAPTASTPTAPPARSRSSSFNATNYWVDVDFAPRPAAARPGHRRGGHGRTGSAA